MKALKTQATSVVKFFTAFEKAMGDATTNQRKAGEVLADVQANSVIHFRADDDTELNVAAQRKAFAKWYEGLGLSAQFVSNALARAEMARLVPELESDLNTNMLKRLAPDLKGKKGQKLTDNQKRKAIQSTIKKAKGIAKTDGRSVINGTDIQKARNPAKRSDVQTERSVADVAKLTETAVLTGSDTESHIAIIAAWLEAVTIQLANRTETAEVSETKAA